MSDTVDPLEFMREKKSYPYPFRIGTKLRDWIKNHAKANNIPGTTVILTALVEYTMRIENSREVKLQSDIETMFDEMSQSFHLVPNDDGTMSFQRVQPAIVRLDSEEEPITEEDGEDGQ